LALEDAWQHFPWIQAFSTDCFPITEKRVRQQLRVPINLRNIFQSKTETLHHSLLPPLNIFLLFSLECELQRFVQHSSHLGVIVNRPLERPNERRISRARIQRTKQNRNLLHIVPLVVNLGFSATREEPCIGQLPHTVDDPDREDVFDVEFRVLRRIECFREPPVTAFNRESGPMILEDKKG
jgi:hypothetical protein